MNVCLSLVHLMTISLLLLQIAFAQAELPQARIVTLNVDPEQVVALHLRPGYVSSVRALEEVSSVVLGDPGGFKAEHSEAEPQLVFFKTTSAKPAQTNALITTRGGHEISLSLVRQGKSDRIQLVDYVLNCERPRSFLIASTHPTVGASTAPWIATGWSDPVPGRAFSPAVVQCLSRHTVMAMLQQLVKTDHSMEALKVGHLRHRCRPLRNCSRPIHRTHLY